MNLRKMKRRQKKKDNLVVGVGWYQESQWNLLLEHSVDKEQLAPTYAEWLAGAHAGLKKIEESGCRNQIILLDVEDMIRWCKENELPLNGASRASYITMKTKENDSAS